MSAVSTIGSAFVRLEPVGPEELSMTEDGQRAHNFLTVAEVAYLTRLSKATVYRLVRAGHMPAVRFGRSYRVTESDVDDYILRATVQDGTPDVRNA